MPWIFPRLVRKQAPSAYERFLDRLTPPLRQAIEDLIAAHQERVDLEAIATAVEARDLNEVVRLLTPGPFTEAQVATLVPIALAAVEQGAAWSARQIGLGFSLTATNPAAVEAAQAVAARLASLSVVEVDRQAVQSLILQAYTEGRTWAQTARSLRDVIGLNEQQAKALENFRAGLVADGVAPARVEQQVASYNARLIRQRAETIARTEIHVASTRGQQALWEQGVASGQINPQTARRYWIANNDACDWCEEVESLNDEGVAIDEPFDTPDGDTIDGPWDSHPRCRCAIGLHVA